MLKQFEVKTRERSQFVNITGEVRKIVRDSGVSDGLCVVYVPHTTAGVTVNEYADPAVAEDIAVHLEAAVPKHSNYRHLEGNSPAHIKASLVGSSVTLLVEDGRVVLGKWQVIFLCEFDGPRNRTVLIKVMPCGS